MAYQAQKNAQGQYITPDGVVITGQSGNTWSDANGRTWSVDANGDNPYVVGNKPAAATPPPAAAPAPAAPPSQTSQNTGQTIDYGNQQAKAAPATPGGGGAPPAGGAPTYSGPKRYNTTPDWQDPYNPPSPGDPYWDAWHAANPDYTGPTANMWPGGPAPQSANNGTSTVPGAAGDPVSAIRAYQNSHPAAGGSSLDDMVKYLQSQGVQATRFMYPGGVASNNELDIPGLGKYKVFSEGNNTWFMGGDDSGGPAAAGPAGPPPGAVQTPEGTWIVNQLDPNLFVDNKGQQWYKDAAGKAQKVPIGFDTQKPNGGQPAPAAAGPTPHPYVTDQGGNLPVNYGTQAIASPTVQGGGNIVGGPVFQGSNVGAMMTENPLVATLMARANQSLKIDPNDPIIRNQTDIFDARQQQARRRYLQELAEKQGSNANIGAETRMSAENAGQNTSEYEAGLMSQEVAARRSEIQNALNGAVGYISDQQRMQLQEELSQLQLLEQRLEFGANLQQRAYEFDVNDQFRNSPLGGA